MVKTSHRILVIDDDADSFALFNELLESDSYIVNRAAGAEEALSHNDLDEYTAIIVDHRFVDSGTVSLLQILRKVAPEGSIMVATGQSDLDSAIATLNEGAADYILKPINPDLLRASLNRIKQLREAQRRTRQAERLAEIGQMVSAVAHESRNVLQRIQAKTELMRLDLADRPESQEDLDTIQDANASLTNMFDELRDYSAPIILDKVVVDLLRSIELAWDHLETRSARKGARLTIQSQLESDSVCCVDLMRIAQVFRNLFENALDSCVVSAEIVVTLSDAKLRGNSAVRVSLRDNGPGFGEEQRLNAFEPFYTTKNAGTGLGLAICKRIIDAHRGCIMISPTTSTGGEVVITLPVATCNSGAPRLQLADQGAVA